MKKIVFAHAIIPMVLMACGGHGGNNPAPQDPQTMHPPSSQQPQPKKPDANNPMPQQPDNKKPSPQKPRLSGPHDPARSLEVGQAVVYFYDDAKAGLGENAADPAATVKGLVSFNTEQSRGDTLNLNIADRNISDSFKLAKERTYRIPHGKQHSKESGNIIIYSGEKGMPFVADDKRTYESFMVSNRAYQYGQFGGFDSGKALGLFTRPGGNMQPMADSLKGKATYLGEAIVAHRAKATGQRLETGKTQLQVDFDMKTAELKIDSSGYHLNEDLLLQRNVFLNRGNAKDAFVLGQFVGKGAEEAYGATRDEDRQVDTVFGAIKQ